MYNDVADPNNRVPFDKMRSRHRAVHTHSQGVFLVNGRSVNVFVDRYRCIYSLFERMPFPNIFVTMVGGNHDIGESGTMGVVRFREVLSEILRKKGKEAMKNWQVFLVGEAAIDALIGWYFLLWRRGRGLCFWPMLASFGLVGWGVFLLAAFLTHPRCILSWKLWLTTGGVAWFSGPTLVLWWLYGAHRWRSGGLIAQIFQKIFGNCGRL